MCGANDGGATVTQDATWFQPICWKVLQRCAVQLVNDVLKVNEDDVIAYWTWCADIPC